MRVFSIILISLFFCSFSIEQKKCLKGYYIDSWKYRPDKPDSINFEYSVTGDVLTKEEENWIYYNDYSNGKLYKEISLDKMTRANTLDSFKTIHFYNEQGINYKDQQLERISFKQSGGCFLYDNKNSEVWYKYSENYNYFDKHNNVIKTIQYFSNRFQQDTVIYIYKYIYDDKDRIIEKKNIVGDSVLKKFKYTYGENYKCTEEFYGEERRKTKVEEFFKDDLLVREKIEFNYWDKPYFYDNKYSYNSNNCKMEMITLLTRDTIINEPIRTRKYYYK